IIPRLLFTGKSRKNYDVGMNSRVKIELSGNNVFTTEIVLNVNDMNYGNHLSNERVLVLAHEARLRYLNSMDASELDCFGQSLIMSDAMIQYLGEGFRGDLVSIDVYLTNAHDYGFDLLYHMHVNGRELAKAKTGLLFFDYDKRKVAKAPSAWKEQLC